MERYRNLSGDSNVAAYDLGDDYLRVRFEDGKTYLYTYLSAGSANIERAKAFALVEAEDSLPRRGGGTRPPAAPHSRSS